MNAQALEVFYDGSCRLCRAEIEAIRATAAPEALVFTDCSAPGFAAAQFEREGASQHAMMQALHARDANGTWYRGVDAFAQLHGRAGLLQIASFWASPRLQPLLKRVYPWVVRNRYWLDRLGLPTLTGFVIHYYAAKAQRRSRHCADGNCSIV